MSEVKVKSNEWDRCTFNNRGAVNSKWADMRWTISRLAHLSQFTYYNRLAGVQTPFERILGLFVLMIPIAAAGAYPTMWAGTVTDCLVFINVLVAMKTNIIQTILGVSWDRALHFHKLIGWSILACAIIHGIPRIFTGSMSMDAIMASSMYQSGMLMLLIIAAQPFLYVLLKRLSYELFFYTHLASYILLVYFSFQHGAHWVGYSGAVLFCDLLVRAVLNSRKVTTKLQVRESGLVELTFDRKFNFRAGQYVFVMIPALDATQWHPLSIASAPHESKITLYIEASLGSWSSGLLSLAAAGASAGASGAGITEVTAFVEGPYGMPSVNLEDDSYKVVVLVSGSIGFTPHLSTANHLLHSHRHGRPLKKLVHVWALPTEKAGMVHAVAVGGHLPNFKMDKTRHRRCTIDTTRDTLSSQPGNESDCGEPRDDQSHITASQSSEEGTADTGIVLPLRTATAASAASAASAAEAAPSGSSIMSRDVYYASVYHTRSRNARKNPADTNNVANTGALTAPTTAPAEPDPVTTTTPGAHTLRIPSDDSDDSDIDVSDAELGLATDIIPLPKVIVGRPNFRILLAAVRKIALNVGERRVALSISGPPSLQTAAINACSDITSSEVQFDINVHSFAL